MPSSVWAAIEAVGRIAERMKANGDEGWSLVSGLADHAATRENDLAELAAKYEGLERQVGEVERRVAEITENLKAGGRENKKMRDSIREAHRLLSLALQHSTVGGKPDQAALGRAIEVLRPFST